jgi:hypothetical protein
MMICVTREEEGPHRRNEASVSWAQETHEQSGIGVQFFSAMEVALIDRFVVRLMLNDTKLKKHGCK